MIVFDLRCGQDHVFEAWFSSSDAYAEQQARGLVSCPLCDDRRVAKAVMAPAVGAKGNQLPACTDIAARKDGLARAARWQAELESRCDYVGTRFADEARRRHAAVAAAPEGAEPVRGIVGETSIATAMDLVADGVPIAPLPFRSRRTADA